jgi:protein-tyrosine-phosphatase
MCSTENGMVSLTRCRGVLVVGATNVARTQIAEAFLRNMTGGSVFVQSAGTRHVSGGGPESVLLPVVADVMHSIHKLDLLPLQCAKGNGCITDRTSFDVVVSITDEAHTVAHTRATVPLVPGNGNAATDEVDELPPSLVTATPAHWATQGDAALVRRRWRMWSVDDDKVNRPGSTRKFSDVYRGEALFYGHYRMTFSQAKIQESWSVAEVAQRRPMERDGSQRVRIEECCVDIERRCRALVNRMDTVFNVDRVAAQVVNSASC